MLNVLRKQAQSFVIQLMVLLIAIVFIFWGVGTNMDNNRNAAATVNGQDISFQEFQQSYEQAVDRYRQQFGGQIPSGLLEGIGVKNQVLNQLIQSELLRQGAEELGLLVSIEEAQRYIQEMEVFKQDGQFDMSRYKSVLSQNRMTPTSFEGSLQNDIMTRRIVDIIGSFAIVSDQEVQAGIDYEEEEIQLAYVLFKSQDYEAEVKVEEDVLATWYEANKEQYKSDPMVRLKYLFFGFSADLAQVELSDSAVENYYQENIDSFTTAEERQARHILFKVSEEESDVTRKEKKKQADKILALVEGGGDFAALATEYSEGPTKVKGGDLGFFSRGQMVQSFDEAVFSLAEGQVSEIVETPFGYHIIKVEAIRPQVVKALDEVREAIVSILKKNGVKGVTFKKATAAYEQIIRAGSLAKFSELQKDNVVQVTEFFSRVTPPDGPLADPAYLETVFKLGQGELSSMVEGEKGYAIFFVDEIRQPEVPVLVDVREKVVVEFNKEKSVEMAKAAAEALLAEMQGNNGLPEGLEYQETQWLKRQGASGEVPYQVTQNAFTQVGKNAIPEQVVTVDKDFYVYEIRATRQSQTTVDEARRSELKQQLLTGQKGKLVTNWIDRARLNAEIWINEEALQ